MKLTWYNAFFAALILSAILCMIYLKKSNSMNSSGTVIILNGPSGSGKSSIQREFQKLMMPDLWIKLGIDTLFDAPMPDITPENLSIWQSPNPIRWVEQSQDAEGKNLITLYVGDQGKRVAYGMNSAIAAYAHVGCNVIVDYIAYDQKWLSDLQEKLKGVRVYFVAVDIPLDILEQREAARGTSPAGHARSHYHTVYGDLRYDLRVSSDKSSPAMIAAEIADHIARQK
jgi:chloramphenicol 3-O phosphotransferase